MRKEGANSGKGPELAEIIEPSRQIFRLGDNGPICENAQEPLGLAGRSTLV